MVTHKEALNKACDAYEIKENDDVLDAMQDAIRAYLDARGLVMVPKEPTREMVAETWLQITNPPVVASIYQTMIAAAPDPFGDAP